MVSCATKHCVLRKRRYVDPCIKLSMDFARRTIATAVRQKCCLTGHATQKKYVRTNLCLNTSVDEHIASAATASRAHCGLLSTEPFSADHALAIHVKTRGFQGRHGSHRSLRSDTYASRTPAGLSGPNASRMRWNAERQCSREAWETIVVSPAAAMW